MVDNGRAQERACDALPDLERIAEHMFRLNFMFWTLRHKNRVEEPHELTEAEFAALDTLVHKGVCTVGSLQKALGVQPAQMSRIVRSLEGKSPETLVQCKLNPKDKRRIDVTVTPAGKQVHDEYTRRRVRANMELLADLSKEEQAEVVRLLGRFEKIMFARMSVRS